MLFGRPGDNPLCHHRALELLARGERERLVRKTLPAGTPFDFGGFEIVREPWPEELLPLAREIAATGEGFLPEG